MQSNGTLDPEEVVIWEGQTSIPPSAIIVAIVLTFVPPFFWGLLFLAFAYWRARSRGKNVVLTNQCLMIRGVGKMSATYLVGDIKRINLTGLGLFGSSEVAVKLRGKTLPRSIGRIKRARELVREVKGLIREADEADRQASAEIA